MTAIHINPFVSSAVARPVKRSSKAASNVATKVAWMAVVISFIQTMKKLRQNHRSRRQLALLSNRLLADIGLTESQRQAEIRKPFWKE